MSTTDAQGDGWPELVRATKTIVVVDLVESVRLMQVNEADVIDRWRRFVHEVRHQVLPPCQGRLVKSLGDGMLLEFEDSPQAVAAALDMHHRISTLSSTHALAPSLFLRIGVHKAEVIVDELDVYGAGVNLTARLAGLAGPGEVVVSAEVHSQLRDGLHATIRDLGLCYLKHIEAPVRAFSLTTAAQAHFSNRLPVSTADLRPGLAIIPFFSRPDAKDDALGYAIADEVIGALSRHPGLRVISRLSTSPFIGRSPDLRQLHSILGATYALSGTYYFSGDRVRLSVELCETSQGSVVWADSAHASVKDLFDGQDLLVPHIVTNVSRCVVAEELMRARSLPMTSLQSYTLFLGATGLMNSLAPADFARAKEVLDYLAERHPRQAAIYAMQAKWHVFKLVQGWATDKQLEGQLARDCARRSMDLNPQESTALTVDGLAKVTVENDFDGARARYCEALKANPQDPYAWAMLSGTLSLIGEHSEAVASASRAINLSPLDPNLFLFESYVSMASLCAGRYAEAASHAHSSIRHNTLHSPSHRLLIAALWMADKKSDAREAAQQYLKVAPHATVGKRPIAARGRSASYGQMLSQALRAAGVPE